MDISAEQVQYLHALLTTIERGEDFEDLRKEDLDAYCEMMNAVQQICGELEQAFPACTQCRQWDAGDDGLCSFCRGEPVRIVGDVIDMSADESVIPF